MLEFLTLLPSPVFQSHSVSTGVERLGSGVSGNHPEEQEEHVQVKHLPTKCKFVPNLNFILLIPFYAPTTHMIVWKWKISCVLQHCLSQKICNFIKNWVPNILPWTVLLGSLGGCVTARIIKAKRGSFPVTFNEFSQLLWLAKYL